MDGKGLFLDLYRFHIDNTSDSGATGVWPRINDSKINPLHAAIHPTYWSASENVEKKKVIFDLHLYDFFSTH